MKKTLTFLTFLLLIAIGDTVYAGDGLQKFYARHRDDEHVESFKLSRFLLAIVPKDAEARELFRFLKSIRIFHMEGANSRRREIVSELRGVLADDRFESLMEFTTGQERAYVYIDQDEKKIRHMLLLVDNDNELVVLQAKTDITFKELNDLLADGKPGSCGGLKKLVSLK